MKLGVLKHMSLRDVWAHEAHSFTPWLAEHLHDLGEALGMELELKAAESRVGAFCCDLVATDLGTGGVVVIENQFGATNHDHLGKTLTYAAGLDAEGIVWLSETFREEHRQALDWLNQRTDQETNFFGVAVELLQIDNSPPAVNFKLVSFPNEWRKKRKAESKSGTSPRAEKYREYFQELIDVLREEHQFTGARVAQAQSWYGFASGFTGVVYGASFAHGKRARIDLYIDMGDEESNLELFRFVEARRELVESQINSDVSWESLDKKQATRVAVYRDGSIDSPESELEETTKWMIEQLLAFKRTFHPILDKYLRVTSDE